MTNKPSSSEKKMTPKVVSIAGTKPSIRNSQLLASTGIPSFDSLLDGGLPVGSIMLIEEDSFDVYSKILLKFYLSEGIVNSHIVYLNSFMDNPNHILRNLPGPCEEKEGSKNSDDPKMRMKIAWRYEEKSMNTLNKHSIKSSYDITKPLDIENHLNLIHVDNSCYAFDELELVNSSYWSILQRIQGIIKHHDLYPNLTKLKSDMLRIAIHSLFSPSWNCNNDNMKENLCSQVTSFFVMLKSIVRSSFSIAVVTVPSHLIANSALMERLYGIVDFSIRLESFQGSPKETNPVYKEYHGLFHVNKLPTINTMMPSLVDYQDWAFHLSRQSLLIKKLHLPPELSETTSRSQEDEPQGLSACSGVNLPKSLDF